MEVKTVEQMQEDDFEPIKSNVIDLLKLEKEEKDEALGGAHEQ